MENYNELLKSPKWQKKRLEVFEKDEWKCVMCFNEEDTLHVHHMWYYQNKKPWEYNTKELVTVCKDCHEHLHGLIGSDRIEIVSINNDIELCKNFLIENPTSSFILSKIQCDNGIWKIEFRHNMTSYFMRTTCVSRLHYFIKNHNHSQIYEFMDNDMKLNYCKFISPRIKGDYGNEL